MSRDKGLNISEIPSTRSRTFEMKCNARDDVDKGSTYR